MPQFVGHLIAHAMVPEIPEFWRAEVHCYLEMSRDEQLQYWRVKRAIMRQPITDGFDEYGVWLRYLSEATGESNLALLLPDEILTEEAAGIYLHLDFDDACWEHDAQA